MTTFDVRLSLRDYTGTIATTGVHAEGVGSFAALDAFVSLYASAVEGLTDGFVSSCEARARFGVNTEQQAVQGSSVRDSLYIFCTNGQRYASIKVPAPSRFPVLSSGPYRGFKVDATQAAGIQAIEALMALISAYQTPTGEDFPVGQWVAAYVDGEL